MEKFIRSFIAIELPEKIQEYLADIIEQLKKADFDARWVKPANIHLTLKFLGNVAEKQLEDIKEVLENLAAKQETFDIRLKNLGAFPRTDYPRVIWTGVDDHEKKLTKLAADIEVALIDLGFEPEDRDFYPHLTLARIKSNRNCYKLKKMIERILPSGSFTADRLTLFQSILSPKGPTYTILHQAYFAKII